MKRLLFLFVVAWLPLISAELPYPALEKLLNVLEVPHGPDLQSIVDATQTRWIQKDKERWEFEKRNEDKRDLLLPLFKELGMIDTVDASGTMYDYALVYGATYGSVVARIEHLVSQYKRGVRFSQVVLLTGQRQLGSFIGERGLPYKTETEMMLDLWKTMPMPESLRTLPYLLVDAPEQEKNGQLVRPTTKDTLVEWLKTKPTPGTCLFVSNQPFSGYQEAVAKCALPSSFTIETIGRQADPKMPVAILLDNLARWLYQENERDKLAVSP